MAGIQLIRMLMQHAEAGGSRSTVLKPVGGMLAIFVSATLLAFYFKLPNLVGTILLICMSISALLYIFSYIFFMFKDKDALRSEKFFLEKMALEKGLIGDNIHGLSIPLILAICST
jgi:hypothetical protein